MLSLRKIQVKKSIKKKSEKAKTAHHEAGHCVMAYLFTDRLTLKCLTVDPKLCKSIHPEYRGGLNIEWHEIPQKHEFDKLDSMVLIAAAGMCAKTIFVDGKLNANSKLHYYIQNPTKNMQADGAFDDYEIAKQFMSPLVNNFGINQGQIFATALNFTFEFLLIDEVWEAVEYIAKQLMLHKKRTFTKEEIPEQIKGAGLDKFLSMYRTQILTCRYPISKERLIYSK